VLEDKRNLRGEIVRIVNSTALQLLRPAMPPGKNLSSTMISFQITGIGIVGMNFTAHFALW
jgi:hypothetical protein